MPSSCGLAQVKAPSGDANDALVEIRRALARLSQRDKVATGFGIEVDTEGRLRVFPHAATTPLINKTSSFTFQDSEFTANCNGTFTANLPTAVGRIGRIFVTKNSGVGVITVDADGAQLIDGAATLTLAAGECAWTQSTGTGWIVVMRL